MHGCLGVFHVVFTQQICIKEECLLHICVYRALESTFLHDSTYKWQKTLRIQGRWHYRRTPAALDTRCFSFSGTDHLREYFVSAYFSQDSYVIGATAKLATLHFADSRMNACWKKTYTSCPWFQISHSSDRAKVDVLGNTSSS